MPTYEYTCRACGHDFERFESITAKPNKLCPKCNKKKAERRISSGGGFLFKGSGFYVTDYKKTAAPAAAKSDAKPETKSSDAKPAESKPADAKAADSKPAESKPASSDSGSKGDGKGGKSSGKVA